jgi:hypothetical protein
MPIIDSWMKSRMPAGVQVFSVNVWERNPEAAKAYIRENNFAMTYLAGDRELSGRYGFDGTIYLCDRRKVILNGITLGTAKNWKTYLVIGCKNYFLKVVRDEKHTFNNANGKCRLADGAKPANLLLHL